MRSSSPRTSWWNDHPFLKLGMLIVSAVNIVLLLAVYLLTNELTAQQKLTDSHVLRLARAGLVQAQITRDLTGAVKTQGETMGEVIDQQDDLSRVEIGLLKHAQETSYIPVDVPPAKGEQGSEDLAVRRTLAGWIVSTGKDDAQKLSWPLRGAINSPYGYRWGSLHPGIDIQAGYGVEIRAALPGRVISAGYSGGYGNMVVLQHANGLRTAYAHQSRIAVHVGQILQQGQLVGYVGSTGFSTGAHLHFEVRVKGQTVDPLKYLPHQ